MTTPWTQILKKIDDWRWEIPVTYKPGMRVPGLIYADERTLELAAAAEASSEHPIAEAVVAGAAERGLTTPAATDFRSAVGRGVRAGVDGVEVLVDPMSSRVLAGAQIDYVRSVAGEGFQVRNPNAVETCGCGHSFRTQDNAGEPDPCDESPAKQAN